MHPVVEFLKEIDRSAGEAPQALLDRILRQCRKLTAAEAGTVFLARDDETQPFLEPMSLQNDRVPLEPANFVVAQNRSSIAGFVAVTGESLLIDDAYAIPADRPYGFNPAVDVSTGYVTRSVACVALRRHDGDVCAVVQLINRLGPDGAAIPFERAQTDFIEAAGMVISGVIERAEMLERLALQNAQLREQYRTIEALQAETESALQDAQRSDRAKSEFLSCIGHELKTPLNSIIGFSELLKNEGFGPLGHPSYKNFAADIADGGHNLLRIVNDILGIVRAGDNARRLRDDGRAAYACVEDTTRAYFETAAEANLILAAEIAEVPASCRIDRVGLQTVLERLIDNAIKFTPAGGEIVVSVGPDEAGGLEIEVRDTGIGLSAEDAQKALAPFGQIDSSLSRHYEGAGLGLTLAAALVSGMNGELSIDGAPDRGTAIRLRFPPAAANAADTPDASGNPQEDRSATS